MDKHKDIWYLAMTWVVVLLLLNALRTSVKEPEPEPSIPASGELTFDIIPHLTPAAQEIAYRNLVGQDTHRLLELSLIHI